MALAELIKQEKETTGQIFTKTSGAEQTTSPLQPLTTRLPDENQKLTPPTPETAKPTWIKRIAIFVSLFAFFNLIGYEIMFSVVYILNRVISVPFQDGAGRNIFGVLPGYIFAPLPLLALSPIILIYCTLKIFDGSRKSWLITLSSLIGTQLFYNPLIVFWMTYNLGKLAFTGESNLPPQSTFEIGGIVSSIINLIPLLVLISVLIAKRKEFVFEDKPLSWTKRVLLSLFIFLIVVPNFTYMGYLYYRSFEKAPGLEEAQEITPFHIYTPTKLPEGYQWEGIMLNKELSLTRTTGIRIVFGRKATKESLQLPLIPIILSESVGLNKLTEEALSNDMEGKAIIQKQPISTAKDGYGFWSQTSITRRLTFLTPDNVLIDIMTVSKADPQSLNLLLTIANSLE